MMPPPSIGRGGGRGGSSRGIKVKSAAISGVSSGRGRGRGRGRGVSNISGGASQAPKGNSSILTLQTQPAALYMEEKQGLCRNIYIYIYIYIMISQLYL